jgi:ABC-2 type transport system ATP-binding protein
MPGVTVLEHSDTTMKLSVDTTQTPVRAVLDHLLTGTSVSDLTVVDPPLEEVIASIYERPQT